jgi:Na+-transporting NADH:ubiquinone oxidoreductase subunit A
LDRVHIIRRGLDIPIAGPASGSVVALEPPATIAYQPQELRGMIPRPVVREGERVERGGPLLFEKGRPELVLRSPVAGTLREIRRGPRRVITDVVVETDPDGPEASLPTFEPFSLLRLDREAAINALMQSGWWAALRTRPLNRVPDPETPADQVQSVLIGAMDTGPLMPGPDQLLDASDAEALQAAVHLLSRIAPKVYLASAGPHPALDKLQGIELHTFRGPHPAGDPAVQVNLVDPPRGTGQVWTIRAWDAAALGRTLLSGRFAAERVVAAVGTGVVQPRLVRTVIGAPIRDVVGEVHPGDQRYILGSVLTGSAVAPDRWTAFGVRAVHVLPDEVDQDLFGWALPMVGVWSFYSAFLKGLLGSRPAGGVDMRPGRYGGVRAIVPMGAYERVVATPEIEPEFLFKALSSGDLEESLRLGLLDLSEEEAALCTYVCPSKIQLDVLLRDGLEQYMKEAG